MDARRRAGLQLSSLQLAVRLPNGNTIINNWHNEWSGKVDPANAPVQAIEVTPDKKVVWALSSWKDPDLGPATSIQLLDEPGKPENQERLILPPSARNNWQSLTS